jgi:hypothetical protein
MTSIIHNERCICGGVPYLERITVVNVGSLQESRCGYAVSCACGRETDIHNSISEAVLAWDNIQMGNEVGNED